MIRIDFTQKYNSSLRSVLEKNSSLYETINTAVKRFVHNSKDTRLRTHALKKRMRGKFAFSVTDDIRIIFMWLGKSAVRFLAIGDHKEVYGKGH